MSEPELNHLKYYFP